MSEQESAGEKSETMAQQVTDPQDPPGGGAGQVEGVVEGVMDRSQFHWTSFVLLTLLNINTVTLDPNTLEFWPIMIYLLNNMTIYNINTEKSY